MHGELSLEGIRLARRRIAGHVRHTPLLPLPALGDELAGGVRLKLENLQVTGSFKVRGAFNTLLQIDTQQRAWGIVAASGGNHGVAVAYVAHRLGIAATIFLPAGASDDRVERVARWGATVVRHGTSWDDAHAQALAQADERGQVYVHPFDSRTVIEGQATLGLELLDDVPGLDAVLVSIGGGGLIGGVAAAIKQLRPEVRVIGVEPVGASSMVDSLSAGQVITLPDVFTIADTLAPRAVSERTRALAERYVDEIVLVSDAQMIAAMRWLWAECNQLVEPAGAAVIAAIRANPRLIDQCRSPVAIICGGNAAAEPVFERYDAAALGVG